MGKPIVKGIPGRPASHRAAGRHAGATAGSSPEDNHASRVYPNSADPTHDGDADPACSAESAATDEVGPGATAEHTATRVHTERGRAECAAGNPTCPAQDSNNANGPACHAANPDQPSACGSAISPRSANYDWAN